MDKKRLIKFLTIFSGIFLGASGMFIFAKAVITPLVDTFSAVFGIILFSLGIALLFTCDGND